MSRTGDIRTVLATVTELDRQWKGKVTVPADATPWMPSDPAQFLVLLIEAIAEAPGDTFLEVGCGIGTRMLLAQELFGLKCYGIEREHEYIKQAWGLGLTAEPVDALGWQSYRDFGIVFFNRPFQDTVKQAQLERQVWEDMAPGAVVIAMNLLAPPPSAWIIVTDDWEARRGVWMKPLGA